MTRTIRNSGLSRRVLDYLLEHPNQQTTTDRQLPAGDLDAEAGLQVRDLLEVVGITRSGDILARSEKGNTIYKLIAI